MTVLFSQAGLSLLHTHQGLPDAHPLSLQMDSDNAAPCTVCALDGITAPAITSDAFSLPAWSTSDFAVSLSESTLFFPPGFSVGRAPPVC
jgi:hypothetical protein